MPDVGTVILGCGSMGVLICDIMHKRGFDAMNCGGQLQLFFGIMGNRWRNLPIKPGNYLLGEYVTMKDRWIENIPDKYVPDTAAFVENRCYW